METAWMLLGLFICICSCQTNVAACWLPPPLRGYRALGFAMAEGSGAADAAGSRWEFLGLLPLFDPPR